MKQIETTQLEEAMPQLISKLQELQSQLSPDEKELFKGIIGAASRHTKAIDMLDEDDAFVKLVYVKPMSVHASDRIRQEFLDLASKFED